MTGHLYPEPGGNGPHYKPDVSRLMAESRRMTTEYRERTAQELLRAGIHLIPCDWLQDHQFVVSRGIYDAVQQLCASHKEDTHDR